MSDMPERIWITKEESVIGLQRSFRASNLDHGEGWPQYHRADAPLTPAEAMARCPEVAALSGHVRRLMAMLEALRQESGRNIEYDEEDAFRMGEWFEEEDILAMNDAAAALAPFTKGSDG